jgi:hypothetical protein
LRRWPSCLDVGPWTNYQLRTRLRDFVDAYNFARRLKIASLPASSLQVMDLLAAIAPAGTCWD